MPFCFTKNMHHTTIIFRQVILFVRVVIWIELRPLENVASMMDHGSEFANIIEEILEGTKSLNPATPDGLKGRILAEFMEAESTIPKVAQTIIKFDKETYPHHLNKLPENKNSLHHLFRKKDGHIAGTLENKKKILDLVQNASNCTGEIIGNILQKLDTVQQNKNNIVWLEWLQAINLSINDRHLLDQPLTQ